MTDPRSRPNVESSRVESNRHLLPFPTVCRCSTGKDSDPSLFACGRETANISLCLSERTHIPRKCCNTWPAGKSAILLPKFGASSPPLCLDISVTSPALYGLY
ncbi:hypothetical protein MPTK1_5g06120 [Marchantia polymorpha subsp. ruderalis]|uniref:Uncharacterized protein n=2 Tax=Marchantia polymorpha TaxID=3197 RepID=A0AAF6BFG7_MARPO|nr:hypothetical protein MARPO_0027s0016 [Marchantia polymorpha]BBN10751.1 hypothetical protein Mp_5g06120 [Marchantia polymorpha subsp. ruderalis]|eukprot:PTQ42883.1 hypothetical protein MARPO_0027s0016 [Marchantia polymorpha]